MQFPSSLWKESCSNRLYTLECVYNTPVYKIRQWGNDSHDVETKMCIVSYRIVLSIQHYIQIFQGMARGISETHPQVSEPGQLFFRDGHYMFFAEGFAAIILDPGRILASKRLYTLAVE